MNFLLSEALAQAGTATGASATPANPIMNFLPLIIIFVLFYFLMLRPQMKKQKEHGTMLKNLKVGDQIVTASGIFGVIKSMTDKIVTVEIAESVRIKLLRSQVSQVTTGNLEAITDVR